MKQKTWKVAAVGECMLELSNPSGQAFSRNMPMNFSFGGDTLNTAIYMARLGMDCAYVTCLGDDPCSTWMLDEWRHENLDTSLVIQLPERVPGLYMIQTDLHGERSFLYWRNEAPARDLLADEERAEKLFHELGDFDLVYLSGITLSLFAENALNSLFNFLQAFCDRGGQIAFDGNYRPRGWQGEKQTRSVFDRMYDLATLALPTFDDEQLLYADNAPAATIDRILSRGVQEVVVKQGARGVTVGTSAGLMEVATTPVENVVDSTAAGDSFNAGYLAARAQGLIPAEAAHWGNRLAGTVIGHPGAIIPRKAMPEITGAALA